MPIHPSVWSASSALPALLFACSPAPQASPGPARMPTLTPQTIATTTLLQAVSPVDEEVVWISGHAGTYARTTDGGRTWEVGRVPGADALEFRDVHAVDEETAYLLSAGSGELSRIYKTSDAGRNWTLQFVNDDPRAFFDCMDFWDDNHGVAYSDASAGRTIILVTEDGGEHWDRVPPTRVPAALPGEGSFAASGTCVETGEDGHAWIGTGNTTVARVLRTTDRGQHWIAAPTPIVSGQAAGIAAVAFRDTLHGMVLGGRIGEPGYSDNVAVTADGGRIWTLAGRPPFDGAVYGAAYVPGATSPTVVAVGPNGAAYSRDEGETWVSLDSLSYWSVGFASPDAGWLVGPEGRVVRVGGL